MAPRGHAIYLFRATFPDGDRVLGHNTPFWPVKANEIPPNVIEDIRSSLRQNPDVTLRDDSIRLMRSPGDIQEMVDALRAEDPNRPLATELGLDKTNRLLAHPEIARGLAAAQGKSIEPEA